MNTKVLLGALTVMAVAAPCLADAVQAPASAWNLKGSRYGFAVAWVDFDGDGVGEQVIGAPYLAVKAGLGGVWTEPGRRVGRGEPNRLLTGGDNFGFSLVNLGDVDRDAREDFAVGAIHGSGSPVRDGDLTGSVSVFLSGRRTPLVLAGEGPMDKFGYALAAGDLNGDGHTDLVVGSPFHSPPDPDDPEHCLTLPNQGAVYVFLGPDFHDSLPLRATRSVSGLGWSVAAGDINGDGFDDLLVGASSRVLAFYGGAGFNPVLATPDVVVAFRGTAVAGFGRTLAVVGDVDGDRCPDVGIGAPAAVVNGKNNAGVAYLLKGGKGTRRVYIDDAPADLIAQWKGSNPFERMGAAIAGLGDLDGDRTTELAIAAPGTDTAAGRLAGRVRVFRGADLSTPALVIDGDVQDAWLGTALAPRQDGVLLIGSSRAHEDSGAAYVIDGAAALTGANGGGRSKP